MSAATLAPEDTHDARLQAHVRPPAWRNPTPQGRYNMVVIGGGTAGLVTAAASAGLGAKVALIERGLLGGDCLNVGCVPSKALLAAARTATAARDARRFGIATARVEVDFPAVMERMRQLRADIAKHDSAARFRDLGVDVFLGEATFVDDRTVAVGDARLEFAKATIATGARAAAPPIAGLEEAGYLTNETLFTLTELPRRLAVIGGGPIGAEMAQAFARFGSEVTLIERADRVLGREDADAADLVAAALEADGVAIRTGRSVVAVESPGREKVVETESEGGSRERVVVDEILVAIGRRPNVDGLGLEYAGVDYDVRTGVTVDDTLRTTNRRVYAAGDVASKYQFTHAADFLARTVVRNALFMGRGKASALTIPWATYTSPELAHVGLTEAEAEARGIPVDVFRQDMGGIDRAVLDGETAGFVKALVEKGTDKILGATIVADHAGDFIAQFSLAMTHGLGLEKFASTVYPYPTQAEAIRKLGDQYKKTKLTPFAAKMLRFMIGLTSS